MPRRSTRISRVILSMKHEVRAMQDRAAQHYQHSSTYGHAGAAGPLSMSQQARRRSITKSVALEIAKSGIRVNGVAPWSHGHRHVDPFYGTPENKAALVTGVPMGRLASRRSLANAIVFIASDEASFITGHVLNVDGGHNR